MRLGGSRAHFIMYCPGGKVRRAGRKRMEEEEENMGQSTISEKILIHLICILSE